MESEKIADFFAFHSLTSGKTRIFPDQEKFGMTHKVRSGKRRQKGFANSILLHDDLLSQNMKGVFIKPHFSAFGISLLHMSSNV
jgi:hypothetical protein